jgi:hypothetical protein
VKYVRTPGFLVGLRRLPDEHRKLFVEAVHELGAELGRGPRDPADWRYLGKVS